MTTVNPDVTGKVNPQIDPATWGLLNTYLQVYRYLVKDFGTSQSPKSTRQRDSRYCPDR
ncbi:MAG: hypothetical protein G8D58_12575, partial [gamma proteobacterium symbiont of Phacoides pectinatus]